MILAYFFAFTLHIYVQTSVAAAVAVISATSYAGETSTISIPIKFISKFSSIVNACHDDNPPISGVPVPGANAGSRQSISNVKYVGSSFNIAFICFEIFIKFSLFKSVNILASYICILLSLANCL